MTATPELTLVGAAPDDSRTGPSPGWLGLVRRALLGSWMGVALSAASSLVLFEGSYAGARDAATAEHAVTAYQPFLEGIGRKFAWLAVAQALALTPVVLGLLLLLRLHPRSARWLSSRGLLPILLGLLAVFAFFVSVAQRHPGLFLPILASNRLLTASASWGSVWGTLVFGGALLGYLLTLFAQPLRRRAGWALVPPLLAGAVWFGGAARPDWGLESSALAAQPPQASERPNILVLAVDSLRPDMIDPEHTPHLSALIAESIYFPNTLVTQPRTGPSWAATLTSLSPLSNGIETMFPDARLSRLETFALPAHLNSLGYRSAVFSEYAGEFFTRAKFGFQVTAVPSVELKDITGQMLMMRMPSLLAAASLLYTQGPAGRRVLGNLANLMRGMANFSSPEVLQHDLLALSRRQRAAAQNEPQAPFFWVVFYSQPHFPYTSSSDFYPKYRVEGSAPELRFGRDAANETPITSAQDRRQLIGLYRAALAETDAAIGELLQRLEAEHQLEQTLIVLLADHGEGLYECPTCFGHGDNLKSLLTLRVPLAFRLPASSYPQARPLRSLDYASQLDVYPTLLSLLGQRKVAYHEGVPLLDPAGQLQPLPPRDHFAESGEWLWPTPAVPADRIQYPAITEIAKLEQGQIVIDSKFAPEIRAGKHRAVIRPPYKLSYEPGATRVAYRLYQFERDPFETEDLAPSHPELVAELKRSLFRSVLRHPQLLPVADYFLTRPEPPPPESF